MSGDLKTCPICFKKFLVLTPNSHVCYPQNQGNVYTRTELPHEVKKKEQMGNKLIEIRRKYL